MSSSSSDYIPTEEEIDDEDDSISSSEDDIDDADDIESLSAGDWELLSDPYADVRANPLPELKRDFEQLHPVLENQHFTPGDCLEFFLTRNVISYLCECINNRAALYFQDQNKESKVFSNKWKPVDAHELFVFISLAILMGVTPLPALYMYWSQNILARGPPVFCQEVMSRNRFLSILKFLRFSPPELVVKERPLTRLEPFMSMLRESCMTLLDPGANFAIDEALVLWKGRLQFRVYIKAKRARYGIKLFCLCPSDTYGKGYTWNFYVDVGKDMYDVSEYSDSKNFSVSERVVIYLARNLLDQGRHIILDNWYMSVRLAQFLLNHNTCVTGTIRPSRGVPKEVREITLQKYQSVFARKGDMLLVKYEDKKSVFVLTTKYNAGFVDKKRYLLGGRQEYFKKPVVIEEYNHLMGAVDFCDQILEPYNYCRKTTAWFKKIGLQLIQRMFLNAKVLFENQGNKISYLEFLMQCCDEILEKNSIPYAVLKFLTCPRKSKIKIHSMIPIPPTAKKKRPQKRCVVCSKSKVRKDSRSMCNKCPGNPGFCCIEHFIAEH